MQPKHTEPEMDVLRNPPATLSPCGADRASLPSTGARTFYEHQFRETAYVHGMGQEVTDLIRALVEQYDLRDQRVLEVGCGRGGLQDAVGRWVGVDLAANAAEGIHKPFVCASAERLPFADGSFDCVWSIHVLEHVPGLEASLEEISRVLKPGGVLLLKPAWFCRPWAAQGYQVRPWRDLDWKGKVIKASIPLRNAVWFRALTVMPCRLWRELGGLLWQGPSRLHHGRLEANYATFWQPDSDACNSIDPHDLLRWFCTRGWETPGRETFGRRISVLGGALLFHKPALAPGPPTQGSPPP